MTESAAMADSANSESLGKPVELAGIKEYGEKGKRKKGKKERTERNWFLSMYCTNLQKDDWEDKNTVHTYRTYVQYLYIRMYSLVCTPSSYDLVEFRVRVLDWCVCGDPKTGGS
jgi:hypothetical protein